MILGPAVREIAQSSVLSDTELKDWKQTPTTVTKEANGNTFRLRNLLYTTEGTISQSLMFILQILFSHSNLVISTVVLL
jgi:hypothetical protein